MSRILVVMEQAQGAWHRMSFEALAAAQALGSQTGLSVEAAVLGSGIESLAQDLTRFQLQAVILAEHPLLDVYTADGYTAALQQLLAELQPALVLFPHTYQVRDFAPKLAARHETVLVSDVTSASAAGGGFTFQRQLYQGKLTGAYQVDARPAFASIQAGAYRADAAAGSAPLRRFSPSLEASAIRQRPEPPFQEAARAVDLSAASVIVSVGRGIGEEGNLPLVQDLAEALGAEIAASRPICDNGWLPMERQVGSSGQTVAPKLYVAVGISGAIQHLVGMKGSGCIVAINKDPNAPIFEVADYGIVGDLFDVVPALTAEVRKVRQA
jgi:electron transfer flavoprotein alpha subunit